MKPSKKYNTHHLVCRSKGGSNSPSNLLVMAEPKHRALHTLFENKLPLEQLADLVMLNQTCLRYEFVREMLNLLNTWQDDNPYKECSFR